MLNKIKQFFKNLIKKAKTIVLIVLVSLGIWGGSQILEVPPEKPLGAIQNPTHFAQIDENSIVIRVLVISQEMVDTGKWGDPSSFIATSREKSNNPRKRYPGIGYTYDAQRDAFIRPQDFPSWTFDEATADWKAPKTRPSNGKHHSWNEEIQEWVEQIVQ